ncbi:hypothetical protein COO59_20460 [Mixta theicola]|uniref:CdiI immunity protein domain-containing protein n=1 Tax=Mixta theicola TaxID=1458355 RepID=A0A2K1Q4B4_9GAMM|nr:contact-dependent growth inhibition system immunity protein [Mixta theicola]PNS09882.1 hypothetical protein COO59_20460 [Mixta theicola]GLR10897.1 hypothetical protein GCM10007905_36170 [Mixta theicola]
MNRFRKWRIRRKFSSLGIMVSVYFGQDREVWGETIEEIVESCCDSRSKDAVRCLKNEITEMLKTEDDSELESRMTLLAEREFAPEPWGETWRSFLQRVLAALQ